MFSILLIIIYIAFISLGLPDAILGSAWPSMYGDLGVPVSYVGIVTVIISVGTIVSSMNSGRLIARFGTGLVTAVSVAMTAAALFGFSVSTSFYMLCLWGIPYGLGAGSVDAALNSFVALHYKSKHMSWLHCFWGIGASAGPYIMGFFLVRNFTWNKGYQAIQMLQVVLAAGLFLTLFLWRKAEGKAENGGRQEKAMKLDQILRIRGAKKMLAAFFCYCAVEATAGLWASSYMVLHKGIDVQTAAKWASLFYLGITAGRFISGFIADRLGDRNMIRLGQAIGIMGILVLLIPAGNTPVFVGLIMIGLGCAPIYPSLIHATPDTFGPENAQAIMGVQMAFAYVGATLMPPLFGVIAERVNIMLYPLFLFLIMAGMIHLVESAGRVVKSEDVREIG
ncbi:MFS transporter [Anaerobium acetethylicum]|uniref:Fucose permease n=1 Tax=Anaerobium acetethylicum TaxID=1619234 RepID=A0A1D3TZ91_9FIRM|nr:MFS transporter [Anaerobium acetethylicum]SCP99805.1 Fucose permease [Anaerobium acetethylicum]